MSSSNIITLSPFFAPTQISACQLWLDGADPNGTGVVPANGSSVASWVDKSGAGRTATQSTSSYQPVLQTNVLAGKSCVYFDGTSVLDMVSYSTNTIPAISMFFVGRQTILGGTFISITAPTGIYARALGGTYGYDYGGYTYRYTPIPTNSDTTSFHIQTLLLPNNAVGNYYFDGTAGDNTNGFSFNNSSFQSTNPSLGAYGRTSGSDAMKGYIAEVIFYHATLTLAQSQQVEGYLAWKWGLVGNLPSSHPYKTIPVYSTSSLPPSFRNVGTIPLAPSSSPFSFFNPASITSMATWLDATDTSTLYSDSNGSTLISSNASSVRYWRDKSTNSNNMRVSSAPNPPTYQTGSFNGQSTLLFNNAYFNAVTLSKVSAQNASIFAFYKSNLGSGTQAPIVYGNISGVSTEVGMYPNYYFHRHNNGNDNGVSITDAYIPLVGEILYSDSSLQYYNNFNNISPGSPVLGTPGNVFYSGYFNVGTYQTGVGLNPQFYIGEVIIYNKLVSTTERQQVEGYLAWKWGLVSNLPSNHPYKNAPPGLAFPSVPSRLIMNNRTFNPTSITGCQLWLDAADTSTITGTNPVTAWTDKSGTSRTVTFSGTSTYSSTNKAVTTSSSAFFYANVDSRKTTVTYLNVFIVYKWQGSGSGTDQTLWGSDFGGGWNRGQILTFPISTSNAYGLTYTGSSPYTVTVSGLNNANQLIYQATYSYGVTNATGVYVNASAASSFVTEAAASSQTSTTNTYFGTINGSTYIAPADFYEVIMYTTSITTQQRQQVEGYLAWKWGLQGNLPSTHPWKKWPPPAS